MRAFYCDPFVLPLPEGHRFPMRKYALLRERLAGDAAIDLHVPPPATDEQLLRVHTAGYLGAVVEGRLDRAAVRRIGFPWSPELVERSRRSVGGTLSACRAALEDGAAANLAGGTHHAYADRGEGFCVFNDVAVAVRDLQARGREDRAGRRRPPLRPGRAGPPRRPVGTGPARRVAILDLDVHQGNGTAAIFADDPEVFTLSIHGEGNYPFRKERSDLDVALPDGTGDDRYLEAVEEGVERALAGGVDLAVYVAGVDPYEGDALGRLAVSRQGMAARDRLVFDRCRARGVPVAVVMSGGYAPDVDAIVDLHAHTVREAARMVGEMEDPVPASAPRR